MYSIDVDRANRELETKTPFERLAWGRDTFGDRFCLTSSFGVQAAVMVHIAAQVDKTIPVLFLETGYHFAETIAYYQYLEKLLGVTVVPVKAKLLRMEFERLYGYAYETDKDFCCEQHKVKPLKEALLGYDCWASGIRRSQTEFRKNVAFLTANNDERGTFKLSPIADYSDNDIELHYKIYDLPRHPLERLGYTSIGCYPCTAKPKPGEEARAGRWRGLDKAECGIHIMGNGEGI